MAWLSPCGPPDREKNKFDTYYNLKPASGTFNLAGGTTTTVSTQRPSAFVAKVAEAMVLDRVPEVAVGVLQAGHSGVAGQEACEGACALLSNIASMGQPEA